MVLRLPNPNQTKRGGVQFPTAPIPDHTTMSIIDNQPLTCCDCGEVATPEQMKADEIRMHRTKIGILCELCYEDYCDRN